MPLGMEVGLGPGQIVSDGDPAPQDGHPHFSSRIYCGQTVPISATAELLFGSATMIKVTTHSPSWYSYDQDQCRVRRE